MSQITSSIVDSDLSRLPTVTSDTSTAPIKSPPFPMSPNLSQKLSGFRSPSNNVEPVPSINDRVGDPKVVEYSVDRQMNAIHPNLSDGTSLEDEPKNEESKVSHDDGSSEVNQANEQKCEGELDIQDVVINPEAQ
ncbi:hypothetical protein HAX54_046522 [Datura stramonium]|uniref:Uncharacterized protein n=1 Tax=Datura stramonium TaxID=4076 RepID=A0ABS8WH52_DATST|nr:hypothetical protein [Datura stramonium]